MSRKRLFVRIEFLSLAIIGFLAHVQVSAQPLKLNRGDHVSYIGNTLADRMQHAGWLETLMHNRFSEHELVFRNLGFPGDEVDKRPRSNNFGSADQWLTKMKSDVVFAFFGYTESHAGMNGLAGFRDRLTKFIDHTLAQKYNGKAAPQLVLFSPIAHENLNSPHLPDGKENNGRLVQYTQVMSEVAKAKGVRFVNLFEPTRSLYAKAQQPLTINGIHLSPDGNRQVAGVIDQALFGPPMAADKGRIEKLNQAVLEKNYYWLSRYRVVDGYNVYGGPSPAGSWEAHDPDTRAGSARGPLASKNYCQRRRGPRGPTTGYHRRVGRVNY